MNDRYLFRAKRINNGEWVEGHIISDDADYDAALFVRYSHGVDMQDDTEYVDIIMVDPSTICQCTGLKDKNGKLIWENDIMCGHLDDKFPEDTTYTRVLWHNNGFYTQENHSSDIAPIDDFSKEYFEVCGNIFDNPELLEVGE